MALNFNCPQCGAPLNANDVECKYCGERIQRQVNYPQQPQQPPYPQTQPQQYQQPQYQQQPFVQNVYVNDGINPSWPIKNKVVAGLLAVFLGGLGIHKFYMGKIGMGILYLLFCWTWIPSIIGFIEGIIYLCSNDHNFQVNNQVRIR